MDSNGPVKAMKEWDVRAAYKKVKGMATNKVVKAEK